MAVEKIRYDGYLLAVRELFRSKYKKDLEFALTLEAAETCNDAFFIRTVNYNNCMLPWIETVFDLSGTSVLEIGCGTGAADLAIAHKCGRVEAFDIDPVSIDIARERAQFFDIRNINYQLLTPEWASPDKISIFRTEIRQEFDMVLLPAVLEHMRMDERLAVLETTWGMLRPGGIMVIYDTPNRLYAYDVHSFRLPFFNWLPDDLALLYASHSPRSQFPAALSQAANPMETLYRLGRGVSYHEFDVSIGLSEFEVVNDGYSHLLTHRAISDVYESVLLNAFERFSPQVPPGFSKQYLELVLRKKWHKIKLLKRHAVRDEMLDGTKPALLVEGDAYLEYSLAGDNYRKLTLEILKHPWSSTLLVCDSKGHSFHREELYSEYPATEVLQITLPRNVDEIQLRVTHNSKSLGNQAWILGAGGAEPDEVGRPIDTAGATEIRDVSSHQTEAPPILRSAPKFEHATRSFTIAFTMRSGSNAICDILAKNGLGLAGEWFQQPLQPSREKPWLDAFVRKVEENQAEGVFGSKMSHDHRAALDANLRKAIAGYRRLDDVLPAHRWVQLVRNDKVLQAISLCRAEASNRWVRTDAGKNQSSEFEYDFFHVLSRVMTIQAGELAWEVYFQQQGIQPLLVVYEDFFRDPEVQLKRLIDHLGGLPLGRTSLELGPKYRVQRDEASNQLRERFVSDLNRIGDPSFPKEIGPSYDRWVRFFAERQWR